MTSDDVRDFVLRYIERVWNEGDDDALETMTTEDYSYRLGGQPPRDRREFRQFLTMTRSAFPDWRVEVHETVVQGESVAVRWSGVVTHSGPFHRIPPTGTRVEVSGINLYLLREGKIASEWEQMDSLGMLQQMGVLPGR